MKRYSIGTVDVVENPDGKWVRHSDAVQTIENYRTNVRRLDIRISTIHLRVNRLLQERLRYDWRATLESILDI